MPYTVKDLIDKFISIEQKGYELFTGISQKENLSQNVVALARVFAREETRHMVLYKKIKESISEEIDIEVDPGLYDKAQKLVNDFKRVNNRAEIREQRELLEFCLNFERENLVLALSIRSFLNNSALKKDEFTDRILSQIVAEEEKHISNIEFFLK